MERLMNEDVPKLDKELLYLLIGLIDDVLNEKRANGSFHFSTLDCRLMVMRNGLKEMWEKDS